MRTARARTSGEYRADVFVMAPPSQGSEPPANPGRFRTNWSVFSDKTGPILGPLMGYEVLSAFFLEADFLGIMLFGRQRVGDGLHMAATAIVAIGTLFSAFWILSVNSWMQTPQGYSINDVGQFVPENWWAIIFNPSFPYRLVHMVLAAYLTTAFVVGGVGAWHLLRGRDTPVAANPDGNRSSVHLGRTDSLCRPGLRPARRVRSGHRHPVPVPQGP
jgi:hypothetical protein